MHRPSRSSVTALIVERYVYDALNARAALTAGGPEASRALARGILRDIGIYLADNMDGLLEARERLAARSDDDGRKMLAFVDETLAGHAGAATAARQAIERAQRG